MRATFLEFLFVLFSLPGLVFGQITKSEVLAPGVTYTTIQDTVTPRRIFLVTVDLQKSRLHFQTVKAKNRLLGLARLSQMVRQFPAGSVLAAINGDFFNKAGAPVNIQVLQGEILREPISYPVFGFTDSEKPFIQRLHFQGTLFTNKGEKFPVNGVNRQWQKDEVVYFNRFFGDSVLANRWGTNLVLKPLERSWKNGRQRFRVEKISKRRKERIPAGGAVLVGHGRAQTWLTEHVKRGEVLTLAFRLLPLKEGVQEATGGLPQILTKGKVTIKFPKKDFTLKRHPRTAVGISRDEKRVVWVVVDGRQPGYSLGMTLPELAAFLKEHGAYNAINLDGGGSTTLIVRGKIANHPSDAAGERPVANGWILLQK